MLKVLSWIMPVLIICGSFVHASSVVTAEKFLRHCQANGLVEKDVQAPETVIICYGGSFKHCLTKYGPCKEKSFVKRLYVMPGRKVGITGDFGVGAPALALEMEKLIVLGTKRFIMLGLAGSLSSDLRVGTFVLCDQALKEDGVASLYLPEDGMFVDADANLSKSWLAFARDRNLDVRTARCWSFSTIFLETPQRIQHAKSQGCSVVEMETAALYAIAKAKNVSALSLIVVSDLVTEEEWFPSIKDQAVKDRVASLCDEIISFCEQH